MSKKDTGSTRSIVMHLPLIFSDRNLGGEEGPHSADDQAGREQGG